MPKGKCNALREQLRERLALIMTSFLVLELLTLIVLIIFIYSDEYSARYYFYIFSLCALMCGTIYFAWHSVVKENAFELGAFLVLSSVLYFHGVYMCVAHSQYTALLVTGVIVLSVSQLIYYVSFIEAYKRFG